MTEWIEGRKEREMDEAWVPATITAFARTTIQDDDDCDDDEDEDDEIEEEEGEGQGGEEEEGEAEKYVSNVLKYPEIEDG